MRSRVTTDLMRVAEIEYATNHIWKAMDFVLPD